PRRDQRGEGRPDDPAEQHGRAVRADLAAQGEPERGGPPDRRHDDAGIRLRSHHARESGGHRGREADRGDPGMSENYQTVLNHLLFHKALISETEGGQRINRYLSMLHEIDQREQAIRKFAPNFHQKVHGEDLTEDIALTWQRLAQFNGEPIPLRSLTVGDVWDEVTVFMSLLFLAHLEKVKLWQKDYPYGEIFVKRLSMEVDLPTEELLAIPVLGPKPIGTPEAVP